MPSLIVALRPSRQVLLLIAIAVLAVLLTHSQVGSLELRADDYATLRPWSPAELREVMTGSWSGSRTFQDQSHRPLTGLYHAGLFEVFGLNAQALHGLSLMELSVVLALLVVFLWRETRAPAIVVAAAVYLVNPLLRDSTSAWIFNQFHLLACLIVLASLLTWQHRRQSADVRAWFPLFMLAAAGWYVKEDTVMVLPGLLVYQAVRARWRGDVPAPSGQLWFTSAVLIAFLVALRFSLLSPFHALQRTGPLTIGAEAMSVIYALGRPFFARAHQTVVPIGTALLAGGALAGLAAMWRRPSSAASQLATLGAILLVAFAVPLAFQSAPGTTGVHLVLLAATIIIAGGIVAVAEWITAQRRVAMTAGAVAVLVAGLWSLHATALSAQADRYAPCSPTQLAADAEVQTWNIVATDVRRWLAQKAAECASGQPVPLNTRMRVIQWIREDGDVLLVNGDATTVSFTIGSSALDAGDTTANITVDGAAHVVPLKTGARTRIEYVLRPNPLSRLRAAHRVDIIMAEGDPPPLVTDLHVNRQPVAR